MLKHLHQEYLTVDRKELAKYLIKGDNRSTKTRALPQMFVAESWRKCGLDIVNAKSLVNLLPVNVPCIDPSSRSPVGSLVPPEPFG